MDIALRTRAAQLQITSGHLSLVDIRNQTICRLASGKYALRAPHSLVTCVYYRYKVLKKEVRHTSQGVATEQWVVVDRGNSVPVPFYLDDGTGKALIDPDGAVISGLQAEEYYGSMAELFTGADLNSDRKVVESVIPEGARLYILGHARPIKNTAVDRRKEYRRRLKALKNSPEAMARYDTDGDGKVSFEEWTQARTDIENQLLAESLTADIKNDTAVVGKHPGHTGYFSFLIAKNRSWWPAIACWSQYSAPSDSR